jgi:hypothetical protein
MGLAVRYAWASSPTLPRRGVAAAADCGGEKNVVVFASM